MVHFHPPHQAQKDLQLAEEPADSRRGVRVPSNLSGVPAFLDYLCLDGRSTAKKE
jgi:hypothetical protein